MRKSSRGNPYHDELGRFTTANGCKVKSERTAEEYEERTKEREEALQKNTQLVTGIMWDVDSDAEGNSLPTEVRVPAGMNEEEISNYLSDEYGFCHEGFTLENDKTLEKHAKGTKQKFTQERITFLGVGKSRCHATIVSELPEKTGKFSNGYADIGDFEHNGKTYTIYKDRDSGGAYSYFATEKKEMTPKGAAGYLGEKDCVDNVVFYGANGVEFEIYGTKHEGYLHVKDGTPYFKPLNGKEYVTVDRYVSTKEYEMRYDYIMDRYDCKEFTEITGSIGGDVERVRIYDNGNVYSK